MAVETQALRIALLRLGCVDALARLQPLDRQLLLGIGEAGARLPSARALAVLVVPVPCGVHHAFDLVPHAVEGGIVEALAQPAIELLARQLDGALAFTDLG
jgi:hypothetical protein